MQQYFKRPPGGRRHDSLSHVKKKICQSGAYVMPVGPFFTFQVWNVGHPGARMK